MKMGYALEADIHYVSPNTYRDEEVSTLTVKGYARVLYTNYRARLMASNNAVLVPQWTKASPFVRNEFIEEARQLLS